MAAENPLEHVVQHPILQVPADLGFLTPEGKITVMSNHITSIIAAGLLLMIFLPLVLRRSKSTDPVERLVPKGFANLIEMICQFLREMIVEPSLGKNADRFVKYVWTVFFFVLTMNLIGMLPIPALTQPFGLHLGGTATANIWTTATLAVCTLVMMVVNGLRLGGMDYIKHFCPGPVWMAPLLVPIEVLISLPAKIIALTIRLFANMVAGHLVLAVLLSFIFSAGAISALAGGLVAVPVVVASIALSLLEVFVAFLQAFIFAFLTTLFIGMSVNVSHDEHHEEGSHGHAGEAAAH